MKVLLQVDVPKLGYLGDVVDVKDGFARNYLLPQGMAVEPTEGNIKAIADEKARQAEVRRMAREELERAANAVDEQEITISARTNEQGHLFGSVSENEIAAKLVELGHAIQAKHIDLHEHFRQAGSYPVTLKFAGDLKATITVHVVSDQAETEEVEAQAEESTDD